jgi:hypothetical protein
MLPAHRRYRGDHVAQVRQIAREKGLPFFLLSGKFGLIHEDRMVPCYDCLLSERDVEPLIRKVRTQLAKRGIHRLWFYNKPKPQWEPYKRVLLGACLRSCRFTLVDIPLSQTVLHCAQ